MKLYDTARAPNPRRVCMTPDDLAPVRRWHARLSARPSAQA